MQNNLNKLDSLCITNFLYFLGLTSSEILQEVLFLWYFCFLPQQSGSITQWHVKMREGPVPS